MPYHHLKSMNDPMFSLIGNLLVFSGVLLLLGAALTLILTHQKYSTWKSASGKVIDVVSRSISPANFHYHPMIEFQTQAGKIIRFESELGFYPQKHKPEQTVTIWYDEQAPQNAMLNLSAAKWTTPLALGNRCTRRRQGTCQRHHS